MSLAVSAGHRIKGLRQAAAVMAPLVVMMIFAACGGSGGGAPTEAPASAAPLSTATLSWDPVTKDTSGETLTDLAGYKIHYGTSADAMSTVELLTDPSQTTYVVTGLVPGTWYFAVSAYSTNGTESALSNIAIKTIS